MRNAHALAALAVGISMISLGSSQALAKRIDAGHMKSWGMAGVSLEQYWIDSAQCAHMAADTDLEGTDPANALVIASRMIDNRGSYDYSAVLAALRLAAPEIQWQRAATIMENNLEACLMGRGYVKFELTNGQYKKLKKLDAGTLERRQYLHSLASDPEVLMEQAVVEES